MQGVDVREGPKVRGRAPGGPAQSCCHGRPHLGGLFPVVHACMGQADTRRFFVVHLTCIFNCTP